MWSNGFQIAGGGTTFPLSPTPNDIYFRTDRGTLYYFDGAGWTAISSPIIPPIGSIIAWAGAGITGVPTGDVDVTYSYNGRAWHVCDGSTVSDIDSPLYGNAIPNLNGTTGNQDGYFLRGSQILGQLQPDATAVNGLSFAGNQLPTHAHNLSSSSGFLGTHPIVTTNTGVLANGGQVFASSAGTPTGTINSTDAETRPKNLGVLWIVRIK